MADVAAGTVVDGRYKVLSRLGSGGMADVFLAEDDQLGRKVALKLLHRRFSEDPGFVERFRREAQAAAGLQHPNVVSVYDRGAYDGTYYIAMEYVPGRSLKQLIRDEAPLDPVRAIDITIQILKAGRFAHRHGIIHRDLKPHNVIVDEAGHVKVTDFGIARAGASDMTETGSIMGTAQYLSPEQAQGHAVSASSDLYSVGVVLYEMLTGRVPFDADAAVTIALKHVSEAPTAPTRINPRIPPELEQVVMWTLNKNPADRPTSADELIAALERAREAILAGSPGERTASMAAVGIVAMAAATTPPDADYANAASEGTVPPGNIYPPPLYEDGGVPPGPPAQDDQKRKLWKDPWLWVAVVLALLLAGGAAAYFLTKSTTQVLVPNVINQQLPVARTILQNEQFQISVTQQVSNKPAQTVIGEIPSGGSKADKGSTVSLTVSSGPAAVNVPSVVGETLSQARKTITQNGLKVGRTISQSNDQFASGTVIDSSPSAGQPVPSGSAITLVVSSGKAKVNVPDVTGQTQQAATSNLVNAGFKVGTVTQQQTTSSPAGTVISQSPSGGTPEVPGTSINIVVAQAPTTANVPGVTGDTASAATNALQSAGFKVSQTTKSVTDKKKDGVVISQSPGAGASAKKGSTVTIVVGKVTSGPTGPTGPATPGP
ncbi:MAG TPA: Stk1 family PASTA domain-containing Ser/Thr kinase [Solirubrobacteraceae bacterium]|jgi:serine/threonine-protein kinase